MVTIDSTHQCADHAIERNNRTPIGLHEKAREDFWSAALR